MSESRFPETGQPPWLAVRVDHRYASFHLDVAFELRARRTVIFGPSGSGKTSLLRSIAGLLEPDAGNIEVHGKTLWQRTRGIHSARFIPPEKRNVGLVLQSPAVFPHLTVAGNIGFALRGMDKSERREKILRFLQIVEADSLADRWPRELSGGQLQRVAIARTLASEPSVLLLDEPFAALDTSSRQRLSQNLHGWALERSVPVLMVTHDLQEAFSAGDEVLTMENGCITAQGNPHEVLAEERERLLLALNTPPS